MATEAHSCNFELSKMAQMAQIFKMVTIDIIS